MRTRTRARAENAHIFKPALDRLDACADDWVVGFYGGGGIVEEEVRSATFIEARQRATNLMGVLARPSALGEDFSYYGDQLYTAIRAYAALFEGEIRGLIARRAPVAEHRRHRVRLNGELVEIAISLEALAEKWKRGASA